MEITLGYRLTEGYANWRVNPGRWNRPYDLQTRPAHYYTLGSHVWVLIPKCIPGKYQKWRSLYESPFEVVRQLGPVNYEVKHNARSGLSMSRK